MVKVITNYPLAVNSPDHIVPVGTKNDNSTNPRFVEFMNQRLSIEFPKDALCMMDLGCSGGQLVKDFRAKGYLAIGLEGSDYSLKRGRACWKELGNRNLFTCDITKPFIIQEEVQGKIEDVKFHLITMWDVIEHIAEADLETLMRNVHCNLKKGGYFIGTTSDEDTLDGGIQHHQTKWPGQKWIEYISKTFQETDIGITENEYVRWNTSPGRGFFCFFKW